MKIDTTFDDMYQYISNTPLSQISKKYFVLSLDKCICDSIERYAGYSMPISVTTGDTMFIYNRFADKHMRYLIKELFTYLSASHGKDILEWKARIFRNELQKALIQIKQYNNVLSEVLS